MGVVPKSSDQPAPQPTPPQPIKPSPLVKETRG